ncbi:hypothetical protein CCHL11_09807 [Colletotrichum chlorophyti]|uniref:Uncharacterized protein n=1 Tax=Colletotrichum chlorophyti TaxID=708187 RepID=A0A1Q8RXD0_9PEZI|nr:hypothetical protein CCHL11_09807 [Colletotrichum chlorophyti]
MVANDICNLEFFTQFADINTPRSIEYGDINSLEPSFGFSDFPAETEEHEGAMSLDIEESYTIQLQCPLKKELWPHILSNGAEIENGIIKRSELSSRSVTSLCEIPLSPSLQDDSSILVEYYFKEVCGMMSCYDSDLNPYRTTISDSWSHSSSLYYIIQSMAVACLSEVSPGFSAASGHLRDKATRSLWDKKEEMEGDPSSLLALVMLGFSLCWHDPSKLGRSEFRLLAQTLSSLENQDRGQTIVDMEKRRFFHNSLVYWRMLLSFVTDSEPPCRGTTQAAQPQPANTSAQGEVHMPHPQTGVGVEVHEVLAQVGALVRKERMRIRQRRHSSRRDIEQSMKAIEAAEALHARLCEIEFPQEDAVIGSGDDMTPTAHLLKTAEAYRCTGLLQLYRNFPDLLVHNTSLIRRGAVSPALSNIASCMDANRQDNDDASASLNTWLTSLALHVLDLMECIPVSSRSRSIQPLLLVSICSELSLNRSFTPVDGMSGNTVESIASSPRMKASPTVTDVLHARRLVIARLSSFEGVLAAKPIRQMLALVKDTWVCMDTQQEDVYWMDVMVEKGYETLMG